MNYAQLRLVMADSGCNLNCSYCLPGHSTAKPPGGQDAICGDKLLAAIGANTFSTISIWGGEPFYNYDGFRKVVAFCDHYYPGIPIIVISNGTAFTQAKIDFINKQNLHITLSHDAYKQSYRGRDFLADAAYREMIGAVNNLAFTTVIHNYNCDIPSIFVYFENIEKMLARKLPWAFELFQLPSADTIRFLPQGKSLMEFANSVDFLLEQFAAGHPFAVSALHKALFNMASIIDKGNHGNTRCGAETRLTVTTSGERAYCQVRAERGDFSFPKAGLPPMCRDCSVRMFCRGICPNATEGYRKKMCVIYKLFYAKLGNFLINLPKTAVNPYFNRVSKIRV